MSASVLRFPATRPSTGNKWAWPVSSLHEVILFYSLQHCPVYSAILDRPGEGRTNRRRGERLSYYVPIRLINWLFVCLFVCLLCCLVDEMILVDDLDSLQTDLQALHTSIQRYTVTAISQMYGYNAG